MTALRGGVLHPPGFPLQAWIDRGIAAVARDHATLAISFFALLAHATAAAWLAATLRFLGVRSAGRVLGAGAFLLFPPVWATAVQPELFALGHLAVAAAMWAAVRASTAAPREAIAGPREATVVGLIGALALTTHPVAIAAAFAWLVAAWRTTRGPRSRANAGFLVAGLVLPTAALYTSLPALRTSSPWPDWGALQTPADVLRHALRFDYGTFSMASASGPNMVSGLEVNAQAIARVWNVALLVAVAGAVVLALRHAGRGVVVVIGGVLIVGFALVASARLPMLSYTAGTLMRLSGPLVMAGAVLIGLGWDWITSGARSVMARRALDAVVAITVIAWLVTGWPEADVSHDRTIDLYARGVAAELPPGAVYVTEGDVESFLGVPDGEIRRFPIAAPQLSLDTYQRSIAPRIEPRLFDGRRIYATWEDVLGECAKQKLTVAGASVGAVALAPAQPELRGLVLVAPPGGAPVVTRETVAAAVRLRPLAAALPELPRRGHAFSRFYALRFARAYAGAALALRIAGDTALAVRADSVQAAIEHTLPAAERNRRLEAFASGAHERGY